MKRHSGDLSFLHVVMLCWTRTSAASQRTYPLVCACLLDVVVVSLGGIGGMGDGEPVEPRSNAENSRRPIRSGAGPLSTNRRGAGTWVPLFARPPPGLAEIDCFGRRSAEASFSIVTHSHT
ncbi:uncharacterized protein B0H64DRAFT_7417 [Chaetomium fimeti]|uniref:Secreted protein n=1 Tax=Chaetomium fimeti TaxID=1854472 RepID=A0AAE0HPS5_9PEZI|nr:hypothetical protein B0H64DRAFT_7417 [Chaetomium fimeti]